MSDTLRQALDHLDRGAWDAAHRLVQEMPGPRAAWLHAYLHRIEGDEETAAYGYRRAGRAPFDGDLAAERGALQAGT